MLLSESLSVGTGVKCRMQKPTGVYETISVGRVTGASARSSGACGRWYSSATGTNAHTRPSVGNECLIGINYM